VHKVKLAQLAQQEHKVLQVLQALLDQQALRVLQVQQVQLEQQEQLQLLLVLQVRLEQQDNLVESHLTTHLATTQATQTQEAELLSSTTLT
jgi:hypothetical protein